MGLLIFYAFISIFFSFLCSILEAVLLSITPTFINVKIKEGKTYGKTLESLKKDVDQPLIAILTINTIAHTVGAILVGVQAKVAYAELYGTESHSFFGIEFTEDIMVGVVSTLMTILILVASEIIPKTIGATYWKQLSNFAAKTLNIMVIALKYTGLFWLLRLFTKLVGGGQHHGSVLSREDFHAMTDMAHEEGVFEKSESTIIKNLLRFDEILVKDIMTPRAVMKIASEEKTIAEFFSDNPKLRFSRIPVYQDKSDNITGFVLKDRVLEEMINQNGAIPLSEIKREILMTRRSTPIPTLFEILIEKREAVALVVDEYGSVSGLVTMEDVIETLLGLEIMDESDSIADLQVLARKNWESRAQASGVIEKQKEKIKSDDSEDSESSEKPEENKK